VTIDKIYIMNITSSIYVLIAVSFCTASANEPSAPREQGDLEKKVKVNTKNIKVLGSKIRKSKANLDDLVEDLNDIDEAVTDLEEKHDGAVTVLEEKIEVLEEALDVALNKLDDLDEAVTGLEEKHDGAVTGLEEKIKRLEEALEEAIEVDLNDLDEAVTSLEEKHDGAVTGLEEKIKLLERALKVEEIQFLGDASMSSTHLSATNCNDGSKSDTEICHSLRGDDDPWWNLRFTNDVVINRIMIYSEIRMKLTAGSRVSILDYAGNTVWYHMIEKEEKRVYVIAVPNIAGRHVLIDETPTGWIVMREVAVFGRYV